MYIHIHRLLEVVQEGAHPDFRCFVSAEPPPVASWKNMPESLMQGSVKVYIHIYIYTCIYIHV
jgi:dynein heavy chain